MAKVSRFLFLIVVSLCLLVGATMPGQALAQYSSVLVDLYKDESFTIQDYEENATDYSVNLIQIAESVDKELFVYLYVPSTIQTDIKATTINISTELHDNLSFKNYKLDYIDGSGVLQKYKVRGLRVCDDPIRYYEISSIYRAWDLRFDEPAEGDNTISEVAFAVSKRYTFVENGGETVVLLTDIETIEITDKYVGMLRYRTAGVTQSGTDNHFVAFNTNINMERLLEADVYYTSQSVYENSNDSSPSFGDISANYVQLSHDDKFSVQATNGWFKHWKYEWNKIQTINEFITTESRDFIFKGAFNTTVKTAITDEGYQDLQGMQWVLRFAETDYDDSYYQGSMLTRREQNYTITGDVTILRLKYEVDGETYNLGVIDNKQTGDGQADNETSVKVKISGWFATFLTIVGLFILALILFPWVPQILNFLIKVVKLLAKGVWKILQGVWWVVSKPLDLFDDGRKK